MNSTLTSDHDDRLESESEDGVDYIGPPATFEDLSSPWTIGSSHVRTRPRDPVKSRCKKGKTMNTKKRRRYRKCAITGLLIGGVVPCL